MLLLILWITSFFDILERMGQNQSPVCQVAALVGRQAMLFGWVRQMQSLLSPTASCFMWWMCWMCVRWRQNTWKCVQCRTGIRIRRSRRHPDRRKFRHWHWLLGTSSPYSPRYLLESHYSNFQWSQQMRLSPCIGPHRTGFADWPACIHSANSAGSECFDNMQVGLLRPFHCGVIASMHRLILTVFWSSSDNNVISNDVRWCRAVDEAEGILGDRNVGKEGAVWEVNTYGV